ncbi:helix-turn-helix domain-containing protein [Halomarina salina]|uniref:Helix-turn-helix domain-containing protein n=1 Tax=Halomarina salina TaxID=1872699 RepID=A0ABD5RP01_9EURY|nr:helix-turn-helix domain-containing protein [Halomarina salina]
MALREPMEHGEPEETHQSESEDVIVQVRIPCEDFALAETLSQFPEVTVSSGAVAGGGGGVLPLLWIDAPDHDRLETALREDSTTTGVARLTTHGEEHLYRLSWTPTVALVVEMLTLKQATILDVSATHEGWRMRVLYRSQRPLRDAMDCCEQHHVGVSVQSIHQSAGDSSGQFGLTTEQYQSLKLAFEAGYFSIPRETNLEDIAEMQDISHQALSERLRRGTETLMEQALFCDGKRAQNCL